MGSRNKISLVAQAGTLGNFFNLHKCKMAADQYRSFLILEPLVPTSSVVPTSFKGSLVRRIQSQCRILISRSISCIKMSTNAKCFVLIGDAVGLYKMLSRFLANLGILEWHCHILYCCLNSQGECQGRLLFTRNYVVS